MKEFVLTYKLNLVVIAVSIGFLLYVIRLILKRRLREEYAIIWFSSTFVLVILSFWSRLLDTVAHALGIQYAPALLFIGALFTILIYLLHLSIKVSKLQEQTKNLTQEIALLKEKIKDKKN